MTEDIIAELRLQSHPEGGFYREYYRSPITVDTPRGLRPTSTAIYFLLGATDVSHLHRIQSDELWCWHQGGVVTITVISPNGTVAELLLGPPDLGGAFAVVVPGNHWFGATTNNCAVLVSAIVAPGFDFADFELGDRQTLEAEYPHLVELIHRLTVSEAP